MAINFSSIIRRSAHLILTCILLSGIFLPSAILAQKEGQITGRVSDAETKEYLPGANVVLKGTGYGDATDKVGNFKISHIPPGTYDMVVTYLGYEPETIKVTIGANGAAIKQNVSLTQSAVKMQEVQVTGLRQGQTKAMNIQKTSDKIVSVVSQEQMVRLPDLNIAEILQRISGISIVRDMGEGRYVQIRGTDARLTAITVNGEKVAAPDAGQRYVSMDVISASQAGSIEVVKALTADMDADAIGGSVNIKSKSAFDKEKAFFDITAGSGTSAILGKPLWQGSFTYGTKFGDENQFGIAITGNYDKWERETWDLESVYDTKTYTGGTAPFALVDLDMRNYNTTRTRYNIAANLEYQPSSENTFFIRGMFNLRDDNEFRRNLYVRPSKGTFTDASTATKSKIYNGLKDRLEEQNITAVSAGGVNKMENMILDYTLSYNYGKTQKADETDPTFVMINTMTIKTSMIDPSRPQYAITSTGAGLDPFDPANFKLDGVKFNNDNATDKGYTGSANLKYSFILGGYPSDLKLGGKINFREKVKLQDRWTYKWGGSTNLLMSQFVGDAASIYDGMYRIGNVIDGSKFRPFFQSNKDKATGMVGTLDHVNSEGASFTANENIYAYYLMDSWKVDDWLFIAGIRGEYTDLDNKSSQVKLDNKGAYLSTTPLEGKLNYNNILPSLHIRYKLSPMANLRLSYTSTLARPNFFDLVPYRIINDVNSTYAEGNPNLRPTTSSNFDFMAEYYFEEGGTISGGVFYKKLTDIIFNTTSKINDPGSIYDRYDYKQPVNGGNSTLFGIEFNWDYQLKFLPGFLDGLGFSVNYAYTNSTADVGNRLTRSVLPGQAANVANFVFSYEKYGFTGRFSINYNGKFIEEVGVDAAHDRVYKEHMQMDFSASQDIIKGLQVYLEIINLNKEPLIYYQGDETRPLQQEFYSWWMHAGLKFKL